MSHYLCMLAILRKWRLFFARIRMRLLLSGLFLTGYIRTNVNRLVFCDRPRNYADLDNMSVYAHNISSNDHNDIIDSGTRRTSSSSSARAASANPAPRRASVVCYRCNKSGHIRRDCRVRLSAAAPSSSQPGNSIS
jgi:hypothetical protein